jgi:hypothetical protein
MECENGTVGERREKGTKIGSEQQSDGVATSEEVRAAAQGRWDLGCCQP